MKKLVAVFLPLFLVLPNFYINVYAVAEPSVSADSAVVMIAATGQVVYEKSAYTKRGMASTTKIMTSIVALENSSATTTVKASDEAVAVEGTSLGIKPGDEIDLLTLVKGMLLESGNDAANVTAQLVSGSTEEFSKLMNDTAKRIGMDLSSFKNPSGLTQAEHYSCAYDMALLGSYAVKNPVFRRICSSKSLSVTFGTPERNVTLYNHNRLLSKYEGAFGIKTGFTKAAGRCLVSAVERDGVTLVCVTLNAYDDWNDHIKLYDYSFPLISKKTVKLSIDKYRVPVVNSPKKYISFKLSKAMYVPFIGTEISYDTDIYLPAFLYADIKSGDCIGMVKLYTKKGILIDKAYILAGENAGTVKTKKKNQTWFDELLKFTEKDRR